MKPVAKKATPAALAVLRQATKLFPKRNKASDGLLPSAAHLKASPNSDHNTGHAVDLTHDPKSGVDCHELFQKFKDDKRVVYLIFDSKIWSRARASEGDRRYTGASPHSKHMHISIDPKHENDKSSWFPWTKKKVFSSPDAVIQSLKNRNPQKCEVPSPKED